MQMYLLRSKLRKLNFAISVSLKARKLPITEHCAPLRKNICLPVAKVLTFYCLSLQGN